jgi:hypothetical protein
MQGKNAISGKIPVQIECKVHLGEFMGHWSSGQALKIPVIIRRHADHSTQPWAIRSDQLD